MHTHFANEILESTLNKLEETSVRSTVTATENVPVLLFHSNPSITPRKSLVAPLGTVNLRGTPLRANPEPMKNTCFNCGERDATVRAFLLKSSIFGARVRS